jgi:AraC-like DNA-binding protein
MGFVVEQRASDSPYVEAVMRGRTVADGTTIRPAESHWHLVLARYRGEARVLVVGPWTAAGALAYAEGAEILWIKFKLGTFMPHRPVRDFVNAEMPLPGAAFHAFWLKSSVWQFPDFDNADTFVDRLARAEVLARDPVVDTVRQHQQHELSSRAVRYRFLRATGLAQSQIEQMERAQQAEALLRQGASILDTVEAAGYSDQPHLTRSLKQWIGYTPGQLQRLSAP